LSARNGGTDQIIMAGMLNNDDRTGDLTGALREGLAYAEAWKFLSPLIASSIPPTITPFLFLYWVQPELWAWRNVIRSLCMTILYTTFCFFYVLYTVKPEPRFWRLIHDETYPIQCYEATFREWTAGCFRSKKIKETPTRPSISDCT